MLTRKQYFILTILLFAIEACIAAFFKDKFIRPVLGDYLIVFLVYFGLKTCVNLKPITAVIATVLFAYTVEILQYVNILKIIGIQPNLATRLILGSAFEWADMLAYTLGGLSLYYLEYYLFIKYKTNKTTL